MPTPIRIKSNNISLHGIDGDKCKCKVQQFYPLKKNTKMKTSIIFAFICLCCVATWAQTVSSESEVADVNLQLENPNEPHIRSKRTLFLKKKLLGAGLLGFGLGVAKGYKVGYKHSPEVHHVYVAAPPPPPVRYVEYIEKPVYIEKIVERPVVKHAEYETPWSQSLPEPSRAYGAPSW